MSKPIIREGGYGRDPVVSVMRDEDFQALERAPRPPWADDHDDGRRYRKRPGFEPVCYRKED